MEFRPFRISLNTTFRGVRARSGVLIRGVDTAGAVRWGEYSPFPDYNSERAGRWWRAAVAAARGDWPVVTRTAVPVNAIVPAVEPHQVGQFLSSTFLRPSGGGTAKVKVAGGEGLEADLARVEAVAEILGVGGKVRVDANGAWDVDTAIKSIRELQAVLTQAEVEFEYAEQPCSTVPELAAVRRRVDVPIAADESVRIPGDVTAVIRASAADVVILKANPLGGVQAALRIAESIDLPVVVSSAMESSVGLAAGFTLAAALPDSDRAHGLGTGLLLATDTVAQPWVPLHGMLHWQELEVQV